jgi:DNA-binding transcriptional MocR family regulator
VSAQYQITGESASEVVRSIEEGIHSGRLPAGQRLPTVRGLAGDLRISPGTAASAYRTLASRGLISTRGRAGTRVSFHPPVAVLPGRTTTALPSIPPGVRDLASGNPDPRLLPSLGEALRRVDPRPRLYDEEPDLPELRALARDRLEADGVAAEQLTLVSGALDGVERALQAHLRPGDRIAVEDPGYVATLDLVRALGLDVEPVALDDAGPLPARLDAALRSGARAVVVTPRAQNPFGSAITPRRASALAAVLASHPGTLLIEDDHGGPVSGAPLVTLTRSHRGHWVNVRSVSKFLGPDLRLAAMAGDETTIARVEGRRMVGPAWVSRVLQQLVLHMWSRPGVERLFHRAEGAYTERRQALLDALRDRGIAGHGRSGLNVWIPVAEEVRTVQLLLEEGWAVQAGERSRLRTPPAIRVTTASLGRRDAERFASTLASALASARRRTG